MPDINDEARASLRLWLHRIAEHTGKSFSQIAKETGIASSTLYRAANQPEYPHVLSTTTIGKLSRFSGVPAPAMGGPQKGDPDGFTEPEAEPYGLAGTTDFDTIVRDWIGDRAGVDAWVLRTRALELAGYLPGDVVIVDLKAQARPHDIVCAQMYDFTTMKAETIWRRYEPPYLVAVSSDASLLKPARDDSAAIKGVVIGTFRPRASA